MTTQLFDPKSLADFPTAPGVYLMKDREGSVIYVGKATNLRNRVRNYFTRTGDTRFSVQFIRRLTANVECIVTANEKEAFLLENTLIKHYQPRYNVRMRDDKTYISLRFRMKHAYPRLEVVRIRRGSDVKPHSGDFYFGPYTSGLAVRETLRFLLKVFPVRTCKDSVFANRTRPCLLYDVGKCCGPCVFPIERKDYADLVSKVALFLNGRSNEVRDLLQARMSEFSEKLEYEKAAMVRDRIAALDETLVKQKANRHGGGDRDVIAIVSRQGRSLIVVQRYREGVLVGSSDYYARNYEQLDPEVLYSFISQHYASGTQIPPMIVVNVEPDDRALLAEWLREQRRGAVALQVGQRGEPARSVQMALENAEQGMQRRLAGERTEDEVLDEIAHKLGLNHPPRTIECVDISNIMGVMAVGSLVRFQDTRPDKAGYRLFKIRTVTGSNDFAMMYEVLSRRFRPEGNAGLPPPDLMMVDGGKGQLGVAARVFEELGITGVALCSIAKSRLKTRELAQTSQQELSLDNIEATTGGTVEGISLNEDKVTVRYRTEERIFLPQRKNPVVFPYNSPALYLLQRVRDEAHRFAITYHKRLRQMANRKSMLDEVPGIGPMRKRALLRHFGSLTAIRAASLEELVEVPGLGTEAAANLHAFLHAPKGGVQVDMITPQNDEMPSDEELLEIEETRE